MFKFCDPTEKTWNQDLKSVFPLTEEYGIRIQQAHLAGRQAAHTQICLIYWEELRSALRAPLVISFYLIDLFLVETT